MGLRLFWFMQKVENQLRTLMKCVLPKTTHKARFMPIEVREDLKKLRSLRIRRCLIEGRVFEHRTRSLQDLRLHNLELLRARLLDLPSLRGAQCPAHDGPGARVPGVGPVCSDAAGQQLCDGDGWQPAWVST